MTKPYVFNYSEKHKLTKEKGYIYNPQKQINVDISGNIFINKYFSGTTIITKAKEDSDEDTIHLGATVITDTVEPSDENRIFSCTETTIQTFAEEPSDEDDFYLGTTVITQKIEPADEDRIIF